MYSKRFLDLIGNAFYIAQVFCASTISFNRKTGLFKTEPETYKLMSINWMMAVTWNFLALGLVVKYWKNGDVDNFHLTLSWWIAYCLIVLGFSVSRYNCSEIASTANAITKLLNKIKGKHKIRLFSTSKYLFGPKTFKNIAL